MVPSVVYISAAS